MATEVFLLPLNTSETDSLKGLSTDLWGGLNASEKGKNRTTEEEVNREKQESLPNNDCDKQR